VVSAGFDEIVRIWDNETGELLQKLEGHKHQIRIICSSPDGQLIASACDDQTIRLWNAVHGTIVNVLKEHSFSLAFSADSKTLLSGNSNFNISFWDVVTGEKKETMPHPSYIQPIVFNPTRTKFATGCSDGKVRLWNFETQELDRIIFENESQVVSLTFSPDGKFLASSFLNPKVKIWNFETQSIVNFEILPGVVGTVNFVPPDGEFIISTDFEENLDFTSTKEIIEKQDDAQGARLKVASFVKSLSCQPISSADEKFTEFVTGHYDGTVAKWRASRESVSDVPNVQFVLLWSTRQKNIDNSEC